MNTNSSGLYTVPQAFIDLEMQMEIKLKDGGYSDDLMATLNTLRKTGELCDVVLKVDNDKVFASRVILSAKSQYFRSMFFGSFRESASPTTEIDLTGIAANISIVEQCVNSLYCGKITLTTETVIDIFILSSYLTLDNILDCCKYFALKTLDLDMVMDYYVLTRRIQLTELSQLISVILKCRFHDVFVLDHDNNISEDIIKELFSQGMFRYCTRESLTHFLDKNNVSDDEIRKSVLSSAVDKDINIPKTPNRPCLLFIANCDEQVKNSSISPLPDSESVTEDESTQIALVIYDTSRRMWLNLGHTFLPFDFELDDNWKSVLVQNRVFFMNEKTNFGFRLCLDNLTWYRFGTDCLWDRVKDPIKFMELVQLNRNLYILVITSTLSNTSHMWIKKMRYFKMADDFSFMPVYEDIRHCHDELVLRFLGKTESRTYFCESGPIVPLMFEDMPGISIEECYHFDANTEESKCYYPPINTTVPVFVVTDNEDDVYMIDDTTVKYKYGSTSSFWEEIQSNEADPEMGDHLPRLSRDLHLFCGNEPEISRDTLQLSGYGPHSEDLPRLSEDLFGKDFTQLKKYLSQFGENFIENSSYTFETDTVWKLDTQTKFCNYLVEITMQDGNFLKKYHPPPPYQKCLYFHVGNISPSILAPLKQASFQNRF